MRWIRFLDAFKVPEGIRIPLLGGLMYNLISSIERNYIRRMRISPNINRTQENVVISLTTYPARINTVYLAIKSLINQTAKARTILLWLSKEQFPKGELPDNLLALVPYGLEIRYCEDLKSHKKYFYALQEFKDTLVVTYDDDLIYSENSLERLLKYHRLFPTSVICNRGLEIVISNNKVSPYRTWNVLSNKGVRIPSLSIMPSTGGGCLYPPGSVDSITFDKHKAMKLSLSADDLWMKAMELRAGTAAVKTVKYHRTFTTVEKEQRDSLAQENCIGGMNDLCMSNLIHEFPELLTHLISQ